MPDQPDDPLHYDMKIPPEKSQSTLKNDSAENSSDQAAEESKDTADPNEPRGGKQENGAAHKG